MHDELLRSYRAELDAVRQAYGGVRQLPDVRFFLFGMGRRRKLIYKAGVLCDGRSGEVVRQWSVTVDTILPPAYTVSITTSEAETVRIVEDEQGIWIEENGRRTYLSDEPVQLPSFAGHPYASVLRVLLQEVLVNIVDGLPLCRGYLSHPATIDQQFSLWILLIPKRHSRPSKQRSELAKRRIFCPSTGSELLRSPHCRRPRTSLFSK